MNVNTEDVPQSTAKSVRDHENTETPGKAETVDIVDEDNDLDKPRRHDLVFVRRLRMGGLKASINTSGFPFNFTNLAAEIDSLTIHGESLAWQDLINRLLYHAAWSVARHAKTSTIVATVFSRFRSTPKEGLPAPAVKALHTAEDTDDVDDSSDGDSIDEYDGSDEKNTSGNNGNTLPPVTKKKRFWRIPIPFASRWAAKTTESEQNTEGNYTSGPPYDNERGAKADVKRGHKKHHKSKNKDSAEKEKKGTTSAAHRADMQKLLGRWSR